MFPGAAYETGTARLEPGDAAVLYTGGIPEGRNASNADYSEEKLIGLVRESRALPAADICPAVLADVRNYAGRNPPGDDITLVVVGRPTAPA